VVKRSLAQTHGLLWALFFVYIITFTVFPAVTFDANLKMLDGVSNAASWFVLMMNTIFSIFDTVGRKLGGMKFFDLSPTSVKVLSAARLIFVATFYLVAF